MAVVCNRFNVGINYVNDDMLWAEWICCLSVSFELDELDRYERYVMSGGDPKKFPWQFRPSGTSHPTSGGNIADQIISEWGSMGQGSSKGTMDEAVRRGFVKRAYQREDGKFVDEQGNEIDVPDGHFFVPKRVNGE